jgi:hypothetical protein
MSLPVGDTAHLEKQRSAPPFFPSSDDNRYDVHRPDARLSFEIKVV